MREWKRKNVALIPKLMYNLTVTHLGAHGQREREIRRKEIRELCKDRLKLDLDTDTPLSQL